MGSFAVCIRLCPIWGVFRLRFGLTFGSNLIQLLPSEVFDADEQALGSAGPDQFVKLGLDRRPVTALSALNQEHHQEDREGGACFHHQLPRIGKSEERPPQDTKGNEDQADNEGNRASGGRATYFEKRVKCFVIIPRPNSGTRAAPKAAEDPKLREEMRRDGKAQPCTRCMEPIRAKVAYCRRRKWRGRRGSNPRPPA